jgi:antimicrobial peptide system SdpB family protein
MTRTPWTNVYGLARSAVALGTLLSLIVDNADILFRPMGRSVIDDPHDWIVKYNFFALWSNDLDAGRFVAAALLMLVVAGYLPRYTAILHWWISASFAMACVPAQGGDHVATVLCLLLMPVALTDSRRWHWSKSISGLAGSRVAWSAVLVARFQIAIVYLWAGVSKLNVKEWVDGTAVYYWFLDPKIGFPVEYHGPVTSFLSNPWVVSFLTWSTIALELTLFVALGMSWRARRFLFPVALIFHAGNIVVFGLVSFFLSMVGALVILLCPADMHIDFSSRFSRLVIELRGRLRSIASMRSPQTTDPS